MPALYQPGQTLALTFLFWSWLLPCWLCAGHRWHALFPCSQLGCWRHSKQDRRHQKLCQLCIKSQKSLKMTAYNKRKRTARHSQKGHQGRWTWPWANLPRQPDLSLWAPGYESKKGLSQIASLPGYWGQVSDRSPDKCLQLQNNQTKSFQPANQKSTKPKDRLWKQTLTFGQSILPSVTQASVAFVRRGSMSGRCSNHYGKSILGGKSIHFVK